CGFGKTGPWSSWKLEAWPLQCRDVQVNLLFALHRVEPGHGCDVQYPVRCGACRANGIAKIESAEQLLFAGGVKYIKLASAGSQIDFAISDQSRGPGFPF